MRFLKLFVLAAVLFFGVVCAQETPKSLPVKSTEDKIDEYKEVERSRKWIFRIFRKKPISKTTISSVLTFTVEPDGTISDISAKGENQSFNEEAELAVKAIQVKWIPGEVNGTKIKSLYSMPIKMRVK